VSDSVTLAHGRDGLRLSPPADLDVTVLSEPGLPALEGGTRAIEEALETPLGSDPIEILARGRQSACILVPDRTRGCPRTLALPPLLRRLKAAGLGPEKVEILAASGLHAPSGADEIKTLIGEIVARDWRVSASDARDESQFVDLSTDSAAAPMRLHRRWVGADLRVIVSLVEPHLLAGYSGGAKMILPGVADVATIRHAHRPAIVGHPASQGGQMRENPLVALTQRAALATPVDFHLATAVNGSGALTGAWAGSLRAAHSAAIARVAGGSRVEVSRPFDAVVTSGGGWPLDRSLYQSLKGLTTGARITRRDGPVWLVAPCDEGPGSADFHRILSQVDGPESFFALIGDPDFFSIDQWMAQHLYSVARDHPVIVQAQALPEVLDRAWLRGRGLTVVSSEQEGWDALRSHLDAGKGRVGVLPRGPHTLAVCAGDPVDTELPPVDERE
jgi:nickel-dependent lactate racemase